MGSKPVGYSASRVAAILGLNPYTTPIHAWQLLMEEKEAGWNKAHDYVLPVFEESSAIRWGHAFESSIIQLVENKFNDEIKDQEKFFQKGRLTCHVDGVFQKMDNGLILHEGKTTCSRAFYNIKDGKRRWGEPETDQVPIEYQIQNAIQRICTGADLVKLSVLVFPKSTEDFEEMGYEITSEKMEKLEYYIMSDGNPHPGFYVNASNLVNRTLIPDDWAHNLAQMGFFHTYNLPTHEPLENAIIEAVEKFHNDNILTGIPPKAQKYTDIQRLVTNPIGSIIATDDLKSMATEYSELTRQLGASGPLAKRKEDLKVNTMDTMMNSKKDDWGDPSDRLILIDPDGGEILANFSETGFRAKRAK